MASNPFVNDFMHILDERLMKFIYSNSFCIIHGTDWLCKVTFHSFCFSTFCSQETESEDDILDEGDDDVEDEHDDEPEVPMHPEPVVKPAIIPAARETERQLSKKERKKKELAELEALLADFGVVQGDTNGQDKSRGKVHNFLANN